MRNYLSRYVYNRKYSAVISDTYISIKLIDEKLQKLGTIRHIGDASYAAKEVVEKIKKCNSIINTFVVSDNPYTAETKRQVEDLMCTKLATSDCKWEDVLSSHGNDRLNCVRSKFGKIPDPYKAWIIKDNYLNFPVCNFIILKYVDSVQRQEIYFGWGYFKDNPDQSVFWSDDPLLIEFFKKYHTSLKQVSTRVDNL